MKVIKQLEENQRKKTSRQQQEQEPDDMELMLEMPAQKPINTAPSVFDEDKEKTGGINTARSAFDSGQWIVDS